MALSDVSIDEWLTWDEERASAYTGTYGRVAYDEATGQPRRAWLAAYTTRAHALCVPPVLSHLHVTVA